MTLYVEEKHAIALAKAIAQEYGLKVAVLPGNNPNAARVAIEVETKNVSEDVINAYKRGFERGLPVIK